MQHYLRWKSGEPPATPAPAPPPVSDDWWTGRADVIDEPHHFCIPGVVDLYLGDCRDVLPQDTRADLVASDVPYGIGYKGDVIANDRDPAETSEWAAPLIERMMKPDTFAFICTRWDVAPVWTRALNDSVLSVPSRIVWDKGSPNGRPSPFVSRTEDILAAQKGKPALRDWVNEAYADFGDEVLHLECGFSDKDLGRIVKADVDLWPIAVPRSNGAGQDHDTRKPVAMGIRMLLNGSDEGDLVLDPFMGTGPFAVAAILTGRQFVGAELEPPHFVEAARRVKAALRLRAPAALAKAA